MKEDLGFSYSDASGGIVIRHHGKVATTLRGRKAANFLLDAEQLGHGELQLRMAKITGNYKRGNERSAGRHPRNEPGNSAGD